MNNAKRTVPAASADLEKKIDLLFATVDRLEALRSRTMLDMSAEDASEFRAIQATLERASVNLAWEARSHVK